MRVRMLTHITGYRNGEAWPERGGEIDLPDREAEELIANGYAAPADEEPDEDTADPADADAADSGHNADQEGDAAPGDEPPATSDTHPTVPVAKAARRSKSR